MSNGKVVIKQGREKPIIQQHPWIFSGAIDAVKGNPTPGDIVTVTDQRGRFLARGYWNPKSQIQVRILTWQDEEINERWWRGMLKRAIDVRAYEKSWADVDRASDLIGKFPSAVRLVNAESDFIPGLIVDKYSLYLVIQSLTLGIERHKETIVSLLVELLHPRGIYERSDVDVRKKEGLELTKGLLWGEDPRHPVKTGLFDVTLLVDIKNGHKTGLYLDQLYNGLTILRYIPNRIMSSSRSCSVLNLFSYTGQFGLNALAKQPTRRDGDEETNQYRSHVFVTNVDSSLPALKLAEESVELNDPEWLKSCEFIQADVFQLLRDYAAEKKQFDVVILDPPKFAHSPRQVDKAAQGYKDINLNAFKCVKSGGYLMTFSCSGAISADLFQKIVFGALVDSGRQAQILKHLGPGDDHPVALTFPEGAYLKGLLLRVY